MIREIVMYGSKVLRREADPIAAVDSEVSGLVQDLFDTLAEADGVGLAAPQIGVLRRVIIVDISGNEPDVPPLALINPVIDIGQGMATAEEGCLSIPDVYGDVSRYTNVEVSALDVHGAPFKVKAEGFMARVLQHEIDHLDGKLFIDYLPPLKRTLLRGPLKRLKREGDAWDRRHAVT
ncbi:MAG: peptide deformylase [Gemmatimonadetes bacterium]|jgi:peptide deformylase|nr:peptide deformylase [Gemmatimonadota bacterium]MBT6146163.1 peptide deformylase [Gemmatimonadota bacterium]MBT7864474.1 peptide deformylase [Gemmatimonadota bacterium]